MVKIYHGRAEDFHDDVDFLLSNIYGPLPIGLRSKPMIVTQSAHRLQQVLEWTSAQLSIVSFWNDETEMALTNVPNFEVDLRDLKPDGNFFPIELPLRLLTAYKYKKLPMTVCDPFMGRGTVGKACQLLGLDFIGVDLSAERVAMAKAYLGL
jgi:hypothetical protein